MEDVFYSYLESEKKKAADAAVAVATAAATAAAAAAADAAIADAKKMQNAWIAWAKSQGLTPPQELLTA